MTKNGFKTSLDKNIWERLWQIANEKGMRTQKEIADMIGIHPHYLSAIKNGRRSFGPTWIRRICAKLGVKEEWLLREGGNENRTQDTKMKDWKEMYENLKWQFQQLKEQYNDLKAAFDKSDSADPRDRSGQVGN